MRKMATVQSISEIRKHPNADNLEIAIINGWQSVVRKGEFSPNEFIVYCEIDSWIPHEIAPFLSKGQEPKEYNGVIGNRLRTITLRGELSQGLLLKSSVIGKDQVLMPGSDVSSVLNIQKWEAPIPRTLSGEVVGKFPTHLVPKTDQERIQNIFEGLNQNDLWEVTLKVDGSSMTVIHFDEQFRVCSRNWELKINQENEKNSMITTYKNLESEFTKLVSNLKTKFGHSDWAFQGELFGPGIQGNKENMKELQFALFDIYDIKNKLYLNAIDRRMVVFESGITHIPVLRTAGKTPETIQAALDFADGPSINNSIREGLVFKNLNDTSISFKVINNKFLLKQK
jgi:RNA ligase (TIGR02306 family)